MKRNTEYRHYAKIRGSSYYKLLLCCLLTLVAMYAHRFFPTRNLILAPSSEVAAYLYMSESPSGESQAYWLDAEQLRWRCVVVADGQDYTCGFHIIIGGGQGTEGLDLSGYDTIHVDIDYTGSDKRLRFYMRNYEPGFSDINRIDTAKFNNVYIPSQFVNDPLTLQLKEFSVGEWWVTTYQVPREFSQPNFRNVVAFGIDLSYPAPIGQHDFKLNRLEFVGLWISAERWYFSILVFWIFVIIAAGAIKLATLRRSVMVERLRLAKLANQNNLLAQQSDKYKQLSMTDHLTGLLNRQGITDYIEDHFGAGVERQVSLLIIDIDHFKQINDTLGHDGGDKVLRAISALITDNIRQTDRAARWGGEEFIVILPNSQPEDAYLTAEKLRSKIACTRFEDFPQLVVTVSIGVGSHQCKDAFHHLFRRVDVALYQAKAQGRNRTVVAAIP